MSQTIQCCPKCGFPFVHCTCKPMTLDDIKRSLEHDAWCLVTEWIRCGDEDSGWPPPGCNCTRRDKIALLERLQEPTEGMREKLMDWLLDTDNIRQNDDGWGITIETVIVPDFATRLLKAAEEAK